MTEAGTSVCGRPGQAAVVEACKLSLHVSDCCPDVPVVSREASGTVDTYDMALAQHVMARGLPCWLSGLVVQLRVGYLPVARQRKLYILYVAACGR